MGAFVRRTRSPGPGRDTVGGARNPGQPVAGPAIGLVASPALALAVLLALATGCTDTTLPPVDDRDTPPPATSTGPIRPDPNFERPRTEEGTALLATFPSPSDLGPGWTYADAVDKDPDPDGIEVGVERETNDIVDGSVPQDCLRLNPMPLPKAAAEVRYRIDGTTVSAFAVWFGDRAVTRAFLTLLVANLDDCKAEKGDSGEDLVGQVVMLGEGIVLANRSPDDPEERRTELLVLTDRSVVLLEAPVALGAEPFTSRGSVRLADTFRKAALQSPAWAQQPD